MALTSAGKANQISDFATFGAAGYNLDLTKSPRESFLAACHCRLMQSTFAHNHTPHEESDSISCAVVVCKKLEAARK